jgi:hypothetical protein
MPFKRTLDGTLAKYMFYEEPLVWVEGIEDIPFYEMIIGSRKCHIEDAMGKPECMKLAEGIINDDLPYIVILDGDYEIILKKRSRHHRVIILEKYSIENFFFDSNVIENSCRKRCKKSPDQIVAEKDFLQLAKKIRNSFLNLLVLDVVNQIEGLGHEILPKSIEAFIEINKEIKFRNDRIKTIVDRFESNIDPKLLNKYKKLINEFIKNNNVSDIIPGHFIFQLLRRFFIIIVEKELKKKPNIDNDGLYMLFINELSKTNNIVFKNLKRRIVKAYSSAINSIDN